MNVNKYYNIFNNGHTPMLIIDSETGEIRDANNAACNYYGYAPDKLLKLKITDINTLSEQEVFEEMKMARKEDRKFFRSRHRLVSGEIKEVEVYSGPMYDEEGPLLFSIIHDVEDKKEMERKAEETSEFKSQFIASMTHEIRTPMNGIVGIIELLEDTMPSDEQKEYLQMLGYSANRLSSIINNVLDFSKIEAGKLELRNIRFNVRKLINDAARYFQIQAGRKGLDLKCNMDSNIPDFLIGDPDKLNQVLFNLLSNALKFTDTGHINLDIGLVGRDGNCVTLNFSISDTGIGIPKEKLQNIFEDFFQVETIKNRKYSGTGLGLSISKKLVQLMGSEIMVESEYKKGCTFSFTVTFPVPLPRDTVGESSVTGKKASHGVLPALNVLVVEDDRINQKIVKNLLEKSSCNVVVAANGKQALKILEKRMFDVILMDIYMPEMNGYDTAKHIRERESATGQYTPIIALTAAAQDEDRDKYLKVGIDDCVAKPCGRSQIYNAIAGVLKSKCKRSVFSLEPLVERLEGDHELVREIIEEVISINYEKELFGGIDSCLKEKDYEKLCSHIHKFKGSISHFQAESIDEVLCEIKEKCKSNDFSEIRTLCIRLKQEYILLKESLRSCHITKK